MQQQHGSGKTAVLVERIIHKIIDEKIDIDKLLVVTFTNSAASEMRERVLDAIYKKLEEEPENENLQRQITLLNNASICTIDSFCLDIVRNNFYELENISPNFRIAEEAEIELLKQEVLEDIFENKYETEEKDFIKLIKTYTSYRDDTPLKELILKIYSYIQSNPFPEKWLKDKIEMFNIDDNMLEEDFSKTHWGEILLKQVEEEVIDSILNLEKISKKLSLEPELESSYQTVRKDIEQLERLQKNLSNWDKSYELVNNIKFVAWPSKKSNLEIKEQAKKIRDEIKKKLQKIFSKTFIYNSKEAIKDIKDMYSILSKLQNLILEFDQEFSKRKRKKNIVDFSDIEHFALQILNEHKEVVEKYQNKYEEIAIDEYQDSNLVQEYILTSISRENNIFMVGDVKQSIYRFRQAMPELFLNKYETYQKKEERKQKENLKIQLFKNFRSKEKILNFTNIIFQNIMSKSLGDINYNKEEYLNLGSAYPETKTEQNEKIEIYVIDQSTEAEIEDQEIKSIEEAGNEEENILQVELEAKFVANKIKKLIESKFQVWDKKQEKYRDITYKDIVILLRTTKSLAPIYEQEILNLKMPVFSDSSQEYLDSIEIQTILNLLKIIDNPLQDIPLVAIMRSNIGKFTDDELIQIRLADKQELFYKCMQKAKLSVDDKLRNKIESFLNQLENWRKEQEYLALDELIWKIYSDTGYYNYVGLMTNGALRQANLQMLFERAKQYETASFKGLYNFLQFIEKVKLSSGDMGAAKILGENDNVIRIMSIHKSKGLEFPVVFLSGTGKQFNLRDLYKNLILQQELGIGVKYIDYEKQIQYDTLSKAAIKEKVYQEILSEEMRILYVALTRAKEKLFITGVTNNYEKQLKQLKSQIEVYEKKDGKINSILLKKQIRLIDWILLVYLYDSKQIEDLAELYVYNKEKILDFCEKIEEEKVDVKEILDNKKINQIEIKKIENILNQKYNYELATKIPTKASVTNLKQKNERVETTFTPPKFTRQDETIKLTGAQKGTLLHLCMQKLEIGKEYDMNSIKDLIKDLTQKEMITKIEEENINTNSIFAFTKSKIWQDIKLAKEIYREKPFYITVSAKEIYGEDIKEKILVQGIIDLYYINKEDEVILVDYKTDFVQKEQELVEKYKTQLDLYKRALEEALNRKVSKVYIYSTYFNKEIEIS